MSENNTLLAGIVLLVFYVVPQVILHLKRSRIEEPEFKPLGEIMRDAV